MTGARHGMVSLQFRPACCQSYDGAMTYFCFLGTFGQRKPWDVYDSTTWQHPMVPPEVLVDPQSLPEHPIMDEKLSTLDVRNFTVCYHVCIERG